MQSHSKFTNLSSAKNIHRAPFSESDSMTRIKYVLALAKIFNCLAMVQINPKLYYSTLKDPTVHFNKKSKLDGPLSTLTPARRIAKREKSLAKEAQHPLRLNQLPH